MKKIKCIECGNIISDNEERCNQCGCPIKAHLKKPNKYFVLGIIYIMFIVCFIIAFNFCRINKEFYFIFKYEEDILWNLILMTISITLLTAIPLTILFLNIYLKKFER